MHSSFVQLAHHIKKYSPEADNKRPSVVDFIYDVKRAPQTTNNLLATNPTLFWLYIYFIAQAFPDVNEASEVDIAQLCFQQSIQCYSSSVCVPHIKPRLLIKSAEGLLTAKSSLYSDVLWIPLAKVMSSNALGLFRTSSIYTLTCKSCPDSISKQDRRVTSLFAPSLSSYPAYESCSQCKTRLTFIANDVDTAFGKFTRLILKVPDEHGLCFNKIPTLCTSQETTPAEFISCLLARVKCAPLKVKERKRNYAAMSNLITSIDVEHLGNVSSPWTMLTYNQPVSRSFEAPDRVTHISPFDTWASLKCASLYTGLVLMQASVNQSLFAGGVRSGSDESEFAQQWMECMRIIGHQGAAGTFVSTPSSQTTSHSTRMTICGEVAPTTYDMVVFTNDARGFKLYIKEVFKDILVIVQFDKQFNPEDHNFVHPNKIVVVHIRGRVGSSSPEAINALKRNCDRHFTLWVIMEFIWTFKAMPGRDQRRIESQIARDVLGLFDPSCLDDYAFVLFLPFDPDPVIQRRVCLCDTGCGIEETCHTEVEESFIRPDVMQTISQLTSKLDSYHLKMLLSFVCLYNRPHEHYKETESLGGIFAASLRLFNTYQPGFWSRFGTGSFVPFTCDANTFAIRSQTTEDDS